MTLRKSGARSLTRCAGGHGAGGHGGINNIAGIGITNQRETTVIWDRENGKRSTMQSSGKIGVRPDDCETLRRAGHEAEITRRTGLLLDPYFSATKIAWLLDHVEGARAAAEAGKLAFGTIDCFLLWRLTGGTTHLTDATNAARTLLFDIEKGAWDEDLCRLFGVPVRLLPQVRDCACRFGETARICSVALSASSVLRVISKQPRWDRAVSPPG